MTDPISDEEIDELFGRDFSLLSPEERALRAVEARDPSTPGRRLMDLIEDHTDEVLDNPGLSLALLEEPTLWSQVHRRARRFLLQSPRCPEAFALVLLDDPEVWWDPLTAILHHPTLPVALRRLAFFRRHSYRIDSETFRTELPVLAQVLPPDDLALLVSAGLLEPLEPVDWGRPTAPIDVEHLATLGDIGAALALRRPDCPSPVLERLLSQQAADARHWVPQHPNLSTEALGQLVDRLVAADLYGMKYALTQNPRLTSEQRARLSSRQGSDNE